MLKGKSILIAGATGGLGEEIVTTLAPQKCSMMLVHRSESDKTARLKSRVKGAPVTFYECDFTQAEAIQDAINIFFDQEKEPYAFVNLIGDPARVDWQKGQISHFQDAFLRNASAPLYSTKEFGLRMRNSS